jgi:hypothetical protein
MNELLNALRGLTLRDAADCTAFVFALTSWCAALWIIFGG